MTPARHDNDVLRALGERASVLTDRAEASMRAGAVVDAARALLAAEAVLQECVGDVSCGLKDRTRPARDRSITTRERGAAAANAALELGAAETDR